SERDLALLRARGSNLPIRRRAQRHVELGTRSFLKFVACPPPPDEETQLCCVRRSDRQAIGTPVLLHPLSPGGAGRGCPWRDENFNTRVCEADGHRGCTRSAPIPCLVSSLFPSCLRRLAIGGNAAAAPERAVRPMVPAAGRPGLGDCRPRCFARDRRIRLSVWNAAHFRTPGRLQPRG